MCSVRSQDEDKCSVVECEYLEEVWLCVGIDGSTEKRQWQCMAAWVRRQSGARCVVCCGCKRIEAKVDSTRTSPVVTHPYYPSLRLLNFTEQRDMVYSA